MNPSAGLRPLVNTRLYCPHCGKVLRLGGKIVDCGRYKKWVDEWLCSIHGLITHSALPMEEPSKSEA
ncbi:MAG TPA: hypothetical protein VGZ47_20045 [Gemmataceae bacterium]|nr:hypothetical protein [Gemmataceae bacterium]